MQNFDLCCMKGNLGIFFLVTFPNNISDKYAWSADPVLTLFTLRFPSNAWNVPTIKNEKIK